MRHLAVIPARGGSKRLPRKNLIEFLGRPIISYTIEAARSAEVFDRVVVSTEDDEIASIAVRYNCEVDVRPVSLATDEATINEVCFDLLDRIGSAHPLTTLTVLYATAPLRNTADIRATHGLLDRGKCEFAMGVTEFEQPVHQALGESDGLLKPIFPELITRRSSAVRRYFAGNGSIYCAFADMFRKNRSFYGSTLRGHIMPRERSIDIDTLDDFRLAEFYGRAQQR